MTYRIVRIEDTSDRDGDPETFVSVQFDHPDTGELLPYSCWIRAGERDVLLASAEGKDALIQSWYPHALAIYASQKAASNHNSVTMRQARLALLGAGLLDRIDAVVTAAGPAARIEWEYAQTVDRDWPLVNQLAAGLGMSDEQIDDLFSAAAQL